MRPRERSVIREDHAELRLSTQTEFLDERSVVAHVVRHDNAALQRRRAEYHVVVLSLEFRSLVLRSHGIDTAPPEFLCDRVAVVLVEQ